MSSRTHETRLAVETITPERARVLLERNMQNRNLRKAVVAAYARDMAAGAWKMTGAPLILSTAEDVIDGQHRLAACILADVPFTTVVNYTDDLSIHGAIDTGLKRTVADELKFRGESNVHALAATLKLLWLYDRDPLDWSATPSSRELVQYLDAYPEIREALKISGRVRSKVPFPLSPLAATTELLLRLHGDEEAGVFCLQIADGVNLANGDPILALRNFAIRVDRDRLYRPDTVEWLAVTIKAANFWIRGQPISHLRWRRVGRGAEPFPRLIPAGVAP